MAIDTKGKTTPDEGIENENKPRRKLPEWLANFRDFFKMVFAAPILLMQRLLLGKDGFQKANAAAQQAEEQRQAEIVVEKRGASLEQDLNQVLAHSKGRYDFTHCEVYPPDIGIDELKLAINLTSKDNTIYTVYLDSNDTLVCSDFVPEKILAQLKDLMNKVDIRQHPDPVEEEPTPMPGASSPPEEPAPTPEPQKEDDSLLALSTVTVDGKEMIQCAYGDTKLLVDTSHIDKDASVDCTLTSPNPDIADSKFKATWDARNYTIKVDGIDGAKVDSEYKQVMFSKACAHAFKEHFNVARLTSGPYANRMNGISCEYIAQSIKSGDASGFYIIHDLFSNKDIVATLNKNGNTTFTHLGVPHDNVDGKPKIEQFNNGISFDASMSGTVIARKIVANYMECVPHDDSSTIVSNNFGYGFYHYDNNSYAAMLFQPQANAIIGISSAPIPDELLQQYIIRDPMLDPSDIDPQRALEDFAKAFLNANKNDIIYGCVDDLIISCTLTENKEYEVSAHFAEQGKVVSSKTINNKEDMQSTLQEVYAAAQKQLGRDTKKDIVESAPSQAEDAPTEEIADSPDVEIEEADPCH